MKRSKFLDPMGLFLWLGIALMNFVVYLFSTIWLGDINLFLSGASLIMGYRNYQDNKF